MAELRYCIWCIFPQPDSIVIPDSVTVYVQLLNSKFLWYHHKLVPERVRHKRTYTSDLSVKNFPHAYCLITENIHCTRVDTSQCLRLSFQMPYCINVPTKWKECSGAASLWDLHAEQLQIPQQMTTLSNPTVVAK